MVLEQALQSVRAAAEGNSGALGHDRATGAVHGSAVPRERAQQQKIAGAVDQAAPLCAGRDTCRAVEGHRLAVAGSKGPPYFTTPALWRIHRYAKGVPRVINAVCDKCCLAGFVQRKETIDYKMAGVAIRELEGNIGV